VPRADGPKRYGENGGNMTATAYGFLLRASTQRVTVPGDQRQTRPARRDDEPLRSRARWPAMTSRPSIRPVTIAC